MNSAGVCGSRWFVFLAYSQIAAGILAGFSKQGASGSTMQIPDGAVKTSLSRIAKLVSRPSFFHCLRHSSSNHMPVTFLRKRVVPNTPCSFEKFLASASGVVIGSGVTIPSIDQVPLLMNMAPSGDDGMAATAEAVSCPAIRHTRTSLVQLSLFASDDRSGASSMPGSDTSGRRFAGRLSLFVICVLHVLVCGLKSCEVDAMLVSVAFLPQSR